MDGIVSDELERLDSAFAGNLLLATFAREQRALLEPFSEVIRLKVGDVVNERGVDVRSTIFPFGSTMVSMIVELGDGRSLEVGSIGREGAVGGVVSCGSAPAFARTQVQVAGPGLRIAMSALEDAKQRSSFIANLFCRYSDYLLSQVMQSVACSNFHSIQERAGHWLLTAQDRAGDRIELTQEALAGLLGVQRTTVNAVVKSLEEEGLVSSRRGIITVTDRAGLKRRACECYSTLETHYARVIGPSGSGSSGDQC